MRDNAETIETDISVIVVTYNSAEVIGPCLAALLAAQDIGSEVFVIDNASSDGSAAIVKHTFPSVSLVANKENVGFAAANNQLIPLCRGRYIFFLNPDTEIFPQCLHAAMVYMDSHPRIGLAGTKIVNTDGSLQWSVSYRYPGERYAKKELDSLPGSVASVLGASMIARAEIIERLQGFDEDFFLYGEDQDLCLRVRKLGYEIGYIDSSVVIHVGGHSEKHSLLSEVWKKKINAEYLFYRKHYSPKTVLRIKRADAIKACWRIMTLKLALPLMKDKRHVKEKLEKYSVIRHTVRKFNPLQQ